ncbi:MAG: peptide-methionine (S)-S-oxide reductase MsrA [Firmicutes bacterium]|nr:peptide-methionine (S)-S-oxide reductase MsrA [Bacillota bacterium]
MENKFCTIYLAGGCFWGMEKLMKSLPGVKKVTSGYANGTDEKDANYNTVCRGHTGFREAVRVEYAPDEISLSAILLVYFYVIDPTQENQQGPDRGTQYQTGIYYEPIDSVSKALIEQAAAIEQSEIDRIRSLGGNGAFKYFSVEIEPLRNFYSAEEYHQNYLEKNPGGYCHIPLNKIEFLAKLPLDSLIYKKPAKDLISDYITSHSVF